VKIVDRYLHERVMPVAPADLLDVFLSPYYGYVVERVVNAIHGDTGQGEAPELPKYERNREPGSTADVDFWTSKDVREIIHSHLNYVVADTAKWEQSAAYFIDTHPDVDAFVKNQGLGFTMPYIHNGVGHDYVPDFIIRLKARGPKDRPRYLVFETKGFDELEDVKRACAVRWVNAVNADGQYGQWHFAVAKSLGEVRTLISQAAKT
jgi:type III restriction enzyme